jgi:hypothetical protein
MSVRDSTLTGASGGLLSGEELPECEFIGRTAGKECSATGSIVRSLGGSWATANLLSAKSSS